MDIIHWWMGWPSWLQDVSVVIFALALLSPRTIVKKN